MHWACFQLENTVSHVTHCKQSSSVCHPLLSFVAYSEWGCIEHEEERWFNVTYQGAQFCQTNGRHKWVINSYLVTLSTNVTVVVLFSSFGPKFQQTNGITLCLPLTPIYLINWSGSFCLICHRHTVGHCHYVQEIYIWLHCSSGTFAFGGSKTSTFSGCLFLAKYAGKVFL